MKLGLQLFLFLAGTALSLPLAFGLAIAVLTPFPGAEGLFVILAPLFWCILFGLVVRVTTGFKG